MLSYPTDCVKKDILVSAAVCIIYNTFSTCHTAWKQVYQNNKTSNCLSERKKTYRMYFGFSLTKTFVYAKWLSEQGGVEQSLL